MSLVVAHSDCHGWNKGHKIILLVCLLMKLEIRIHINVMKC